MNVESSYCISTIALTIKISFPRISSGTLLSCSFTPSPLHPGDDLHSGVAIIRVVRDRHEVRFDCVTAIRTPAPVLLLELIRGVNWFDIFCL